jgi:hypothetical protein
MTRPSVAQPYGVNRAALPSSRLASLLPSLERVPCSEGLNRYAACEVGKAGCATAVCAHNKRVAIAPGATRVAGGVNFKRKYAPSFPTVQILEATPRRTVTQAELEALGLLGAPDPMPVRPLRRAGQGRGAKQWPSYERCLQNVPPAHHSDRPDVSRADFTFCLLAIDWVGLSRIPARVCLREVAKPVRLGKHMPG